MSKTTVKKPITIELVVKNIIKYFNFPNDDGVKHLIHRELNNVSYATIEELVEVYREKKFYIGNLLNNKDKANAFGSKFARVKYLMKVTHSCWEKMKATNES